MRYVGREQRRFDEPAYDEHGSNRPCGGFTEPVQVAQLLPSTRRRGMLGGMAKPVAKLAVLIKPKHVWVPALLITGMLLVAIVYLRWQGRVWWCEQGDWWPMSIEVNSPHNSQHVFDAYSLSHVLHGVLFYGFFWLFRAPMSLGWRLVAATAVEVTWEMMENSPLIINRYRAATIAVGYQGDSIINSLGDVLSFVVGFYVGQRLGLWKSVLFFLAVDLGMLWMIRDNLALNVLMLLWPIDAIRSWQAAG